MFDMLLQHNYSSNWFDHILKHYYYNKYIIVRTFVLAGNICLEHKQIWSVYVLANRNKEDEVSEWVFPPLLRVF